MTDRIPVMLSVSVSLPDTLVEWLDEVAEERDGGNRSRTLRRLLRDERDRRQRRKREVR